MLVINSVQGEAVLTKYLGRKGLNSPITLEPPVQNMTSMSTQANPPPAFRISSSGPESPPSVLTPELSL